MYQINVFNPMLLIKYVIRNMILHRVSGSIVNISSISVHTGYKGLAFMHHQKGLWKRSLKFNREWGSMGIRSNCIVAGFMDTKMSSSLSKEQKGFIIELLKFPTSKKSVAKTILYLLSPDSKSITGQNIFVDSGTI